MKVKHPVVKALAVAGAALAAYAVYHAVKDRDEFDCFCDCDDDTCGCCDKDKVVGCTKEAPEENE